MEHLKDDDASKVLLQQQKFLRPNSFISFPLICHHRLYCSSLLLSLISCYIKVMTDNVNIYQKEKMRTGRKLFAENKRKNNLHGRLCY